MKIDRNQKFKSGEIIVITEGEHSDYDLQGVFRVSRDFDAAEINRRINTNIDFETWLLVNGYLIEIEFRELSIVDGVYNRTILVSKK